MGSNKRQSPARAGARAGGMILLVAMAVAAGFLLREVFFAEQPRGPGGAVQVPTLEQAQPPGSEGSLSSLVQQVAANFKCACGGCGELPLATCTCDMPRGALEEKAFIRSKLSQGLSVEQVVELVDLEYGHRI